MQTTLRQLNFDGMTELTEGGREFLDRINKINRIGADEGDLFRPFTFHALSGGPVLSTAFGLQKHFTSINPW